MASDMWVRLLIAATLLWASGPAFAEPPDCEADNPPPACKSDNTPPTVPTGLVATVVSGSQINLSWTASTDSNGVYGYSVERCAGSACSNFAQFADAVSTTSYSDVGLSSGVTYRYRVRAFDPAFNYSAYSSVISATTLDTQAPTSPGGLTASAVSQAQINLSWSTSSDNVAVTGYAVERCQGAGCANFTQVATTTTTSYSSTGLAAAASYSFRIRAYDAIPNYSGYSATASATTPDTQAPTSPVGFTASAASQAQINLSWSASSDNVAVAGYAVERCQGAGCTNFTQVATATATSYSSTGLAAAASYSFRIRAYDAVSNYSGYSATASATTPDTQAPTSPDGLTAITVSNTQIDLSWAASADNVAVIEYLVERCQGASCANFTQIATVTALAYSDTGLAGVTTYRYRVRARDAVPNYGAYSAIALATTPDGQAPTTPTGLTITAGPNQLVLSWTAASDDVGVTAYLIERCQGAGCTNYAQIASVTTTSYTDTNVAAATSYSYRVRARDAVPNYSSYSSVGTALPATCD